MLFSPNEVLKKDGTPYKVYTPYSRVWLRQMEEQGVPNYPTQKHLKKLHSFSAVLPSLSELGFTESEHKIPQPNTSTALIDGYEANRNFPAVDGTSRLGIYLRFGAISPRKMISKAAESADITF